MASFQLEGYVWQEIVWEDDWLISNRSTLADKLLGFLLTRHSTMHCTAVWHTWILQSRAICTCAHSCGYFLLSTVIVDMQPALQCLLYSAEGLAPMVFICIGHLVQLFVALFKADYNYYRAVGTGIDFRVKFL